MTALNELIQASIMANMSNNEALKRINQAGYELLDLRSEIKRLKADQWELLTQLSDLASEHEKLKAERLKLYNDNALLIKAFKEAEPEMVKLGLWEVDIQFSQPPEEMK